MTESEYLDRVDTMLKGPWQAAVEARNAAQAALDQITEVKMELTTRRIELSKAQLAARDKETG